MLNEADAKKLADRVLSLSKAEQMQITIGGGDNANLRYAANNVTTSGFIENTAVSIEAFFGKRHGSTNTSDLSDEGLLRAVRSAEEIARYAPEDEELQPMLGPQKYREANNYQEKTAHADPSWRAQVAANCLKPAREQKLVASGFVQNGGNFRAIANSKGLFGYYRQSDCSYSTTVRTADGKGSGWAAQSSLSIDDLNGKTIASRAIEKAIASQNPQPLDAGQYTVILEPQAVSDLIPAVAFGMDARGAEEGRSFMSKKDGGTRLGEKVFSDVVNIYSDPFSPLSPSDPFDFEGLPAERIEIVRGGVVKNLFYSRYWAAKTGKTATASPTSIVMEGGNTSIAEMIASTKRGVLVTHFFYIRLFDAQTLLFTGLTRDGTFLIEDGKIKHPVNNFRFNESPIAILNNIEAMSPAQHTDNSSIVVPALKVRNFNFSSISDAI